MFRNLFFFLFTHFAVGLLCTILFVSLAEIGGLFYRLNTGIAFCLLAASIWVQPFGAIDLTILANAPAGSAQVWEQLTYLFLGVSGLILIIYNVLHPRLHLALLIVSVMAGLSGVACYALAAQVPFTIPAVSAELVVLHEVVAALALGSVLGAMITGHWYLVQHKLSMTPLRNSSRLYMASISLRVLLVGGTLLLYWNLSTERLVRLLTQMNFESLVFYFRFGFGLVLPLIFAFMIWSAVKIRSTQSATGMLYATIVLVLLGEMFGRILSMSVGLPL